MRLLCKIIAAGLLLSCSPSERTETQPLKAEPKAETHFPPQETGFISVTEPSGATLYVDGERWSEKTPTKVHVGVGTHDVRFELANFISAEGQETARLNQMVSTSVVKLDPHQGSIEWSSAESIGDFHVRLDYQGRSFELFSSGELRTAFDSADQSGQTMAFHCDVQTSSEQIEVLLSKSQLNGVMTHLRYPPDPRAPWNWESDKWGTTAKLSISAYGHIEEANVEYYLFDEVAQLVRQLHLLARPCFHWIEGSLARRRASTQWWPCVSQVYGEKADHESFDLPIVDVDFDGATGAPTQIKVVHGTAQLEPCLLTALSLVPVASSTKTTPRFRWRLEKPE